MAERTIYRHLAERGPIAEKLQDLAPGGLNFRFDGQPTKTATPDVIYAVGRMRPRAF